jgi:hypothetical protein
MENLVAGDLEIVAADPGPEGPLVFTWLGKSDDRHPARILVPYFTAILDAAAGRAVEMRFAEVDHLNSSTIAAIIRFIQDARARGARLVLVYDQALKWQKLSFDALRVFARDDLLELRTV